MTLGEVLSQHKQAFVADRDDRDSLIIRTRIYLEGICLSDLVYFDQHPVTDWDGQCFLAARFLQEFPDPEHLHLLPVELQPPVRRLWERIQVHIEAAVQAHRAEAELKEEAYDVLPGIDPSEILVNVSPLELRWYNADSVKSPSSPLN